MNPEYRLIAIREPLNEQPLPGMEAQLELPFPAMRLGDGAWHKVFGLVTNLDLPGDELVWWSRQRCGKGEEVHGNRLSPRWRRGGRPAPRRSWKLGSHDSSRRLSNVLAHESNRKSRAGYELKPI